MAWREKTTEETYGDKEAEERLKQELPLWYLEDGWIRRKYKTSGWKGTLMVVNTVGHLAEAAFHHPDRGHRLRFPLLGPGRPDYHD